jgi:hypothetical protein
MKKRIVVSVLVQQLFFLLGSPKIMDNGELRIDNGEWIMDNGEWGR